MSSFVTFDNFYDEVKFYCHGQPKKAAGLGEAITGIDHPLADVWIRYAEDRGWTKRAEFFAKMLRSGNTLTMPCANPKDFDPSYVPKPRQPKARSYETVSMSPSARQRVIESAMRGLRKHPYDRRREDNEVERPMSHAEILDGLKQKFVEEPVGISATLAATMGLYQPKAAE